MPVPAGWQRGSEDAPSPSSLQAGSAAWSSVPAKPHLRAGTEIQCKYCELMSAVDVIPVNPELLQGSHTSWNARIPWHCRAPGLAGAPPQDEGDAGRALLCPPAFLLPHVHTDAPGHARGHLSGTAGSCVRQPVGICRVVAQLSLGSANFHSSHDPNPSLMRC